MIVVTGATGQLGRLVIRSLLRSVPAGEIVAAARHPDKASDLAALGVQVRHADYDRPDTLATALAGADRLLLVSSSEIGKRVAQHRAVIEAAKAQGVGLLAYTSLLHADTSPLGLAVEHRHTEAAIAESGVPAVLLRNGWYTENYTGGIPAALVHGVLLGSAGQGRIASATRADYADAAAAVLVSGVDQAGRIHELAGDQAYTLAELAAEVTRQSGKTVVYRDLPQAQYKDALEQAGLPGPVAEAISASDAAVAQGALFDDSRQLSALIGRPTTPMAQTVAAQLEATAG